MLKLDQKWQHLMLLQIIFFFVACGATKSPFDEKSQLKMIQEPEGYYRAPLRIVNRKMTRGVKGLGSFYLQGNQFYAKIRLYTFWKNQIHIQAVHEGDRCPDESDDVNADGFVDFVEAQRAVGRMLIPLDGSLRSQKKGMTEYPASNQSGTYLYIKTDSVLLMMRDLRKRVTRWNPILTKLETKADLDLPKRTVMIYGVPASHKLPATIESFGQYARNMTLPIACGILSETDEVFP